MSSFFRRRLEYQKVAPSDVLDANKEAFVHEEDPFSSRNRLQEDKDAILLPITTTLRRILVLAQPERNLLIVSTIMMIFSSAVSLAIPTYSGRIIDAALAGDDDDTTDDDADDDHDSPMQLLLTLLAFMTVAGIGDLFKKREAAEAIAWAMASS